jgi:hypothetical protein
MKRGRPARVDYEYERNGTANLFMLFAPLEGWRKRLKDKSCFSRWSRARGTCRGLVSAAEESVEMAGK